MGMKLFAFVVTADHPEKGTIATPGTVLDHSMDHVKEGLDFLAIQQFPFSKGWNGHAIHVAQNPDVYYVHGRKYHITITEEEGQEEEQEQEEEEEEEEEDIDALIQRVLPALRILADHALVEQSIIERLTIERFEEKRRRESYAKHD